MERKSKYSEFTGSQNVTPLIGMRIIAALNGLELFGHEREAIEVFKTLRNLGVRVIVGVNSVETDNKVGAKLNELAFETFPIPFGNQWSWMWLKKYPMSVFEKASQVFRCSRVFAKMIRRIKPDYVLLSSPLAYSYVAPALTLSSTTLLYRIVDSPPLASPFGLAIWRAATRRSTKIIAISKFVHDQVVAVSPSRIGKRACLIYGAAGHHEEAETNIIKEDRILYVGQITSSKGLSQLVEAFAVLAVSNASLTLDIVGGSSFSREFFEQCVRSRVDQLGLSDRILFHGFLDDPTPFLRRALFQVVPSISEEPLGIVVLEAKAFGLPVVVFPSGGLPEMVRHEVDGYICRNVSVEALVDGMDWLLQRKSELQKIGQRGRDDYQTRFGIERFGHEWVEVLTSLNNRSTAWPS